MGEELNSAKDICFSVGRKDGWCEFLHNNDANTIGLPLLKIVKSEFKPHHGALRFRPTSPQTAGLGWVFGSCLLGYGAGPMCKRKLATIDI